MLNLESCKSDAKREKSLAQPGSLEPVLQTQCSEPIHLFDDKDVKQVRQSLAWSSELVLKAEVKTTGSLSVLEVSHDYANNPGFLAWQMCTDTCTEWKRDYRPFFEIADIPPGAVHFNAKLCVTDPSFVTEGISSKDGLCCAESKQWVLEMGDNSTADKTDLEDIQADNDRAKLIFARAEKIINISKNEIGKRKLKTQKEARNSSFEDNILWNLANKDVWILAHQLDVDIPQTLSDLDEKQASGLLETLPKTELVKLENGGYGLVETNCSQEVGLGLDSHARLPGLPPTSGRLSGATEAPRLPSTLLPPPRKRLSDTIPRATDLLEVDITPKNVPQILIKEKVTQQEWDQLGKLVYKQAKLLARWNSLYKLNPTSIEIEARLIQAWNWFKGDLAILPAIVATTRSSPRPPTPAVPSTPGVSSTPVSFPPGGLTDQVFEARANTSPALPPSPRTIENDPGVRRRVDAAEQQGDALMTLENRWKISVSNPDLVDPSSLPQAPRRKKRAPQPKEDATRALEGT